MGVMSERVSGEQGAHMESNSEYASTSTDRVEADLELIEFYTSSVGLKGQSYEHNGDHQADSGRQHDALIRQYDRGTVTKHDAFARTVAVVSPEHRATLDLVYLPFGTGFDERCPYECGRCAERYVSAVPKCPSCSSKRDQVKRGPGSEVDLLALALPARWGHGSYVRMAIGQSRTLETYRKSYPSAASEPPVADLLRFLAHEAGRGPERESFFARLREDCSVPHTRAVDAYSALRVDRIAEEIKARRAARAVREAKSAALLEAELGAKSRRARDRYERRLRG